MMWWRLIVNQRWNGKRRVGAQAWRMCDESRIRGRWGFGRLLLAFVVGGASVSERLKRVLGSGHEEQLG